MVNAAYRTLYTLFQEPRLCWISLPGLLLAQQLLNLMEAKDKSVYLFFCIVMG